MSWVQVLKLACLFLLHPDLGVLVHRLTFPRGLTVPAHILRLTGLVSSQVVGAGLVRDTVGKDPGVGSCWISSLTAVGFVLLQRKEVHWAFLLTLDLLDIYYQCMCKENLKVWEGWALHLLELVLRKHSQSHSQ